jgi:hypothetical protein
VDEPLGMGGLVDANRTWGGRVGDVVRAIASVALAGALGALIFSAIIQEAAERKIFGTHRHDFLRRLGQLFGGPEDGLRTRGMQIAILFFALVAAGVTLVEAKLPKRTAIAALWLVPIPFFAWGAGLSRAADTRVEGRGDGWFAVSTSSRVAPLLLALLASYCAMAMVIRIVRVMRLADWWRPERLPPSRGFQ